MEGFDDEDEARDLCISISAVSISIAVEFDGVWSKALISSAMEESTFTELQTWSLLQNQEIWRSFAETSRHSSIVHAVPNANLICVLAFLVTMQLSCLKMPYR